MCTCIHSLLYEVYNPIVHTWKGKEGNLEDEEEVGPPLPPGYGVGGVEGGGRGDAANSDDDEEEEEGVEQEEDVCATNFMY